MTHFAVHVFPPFPICGSLNVFCSHNLLGRGTTRRCGHVVGSVSLKVSFEASEAQIKPGGSLFLPATDQFKCRTLGYLSSTISAHVPQYYSPG